MKRGEWITEFDVLELMKLSYGRNMKMFNKLVSIKTYIDDFEFDVEEFLKDWETDKRLKRTTNGSKR